MIGSTTLLRFYVVPLLLRGRDFMGVLDFAAKYDRMSTRVFELELDKPIGHPVRTMY